MRKVRGSIPFSFRFLKGKQQLWAVLPMAGGGSCIPDLEHKKCLVLMYVGWMNTCIYA